MVEANNKTTVRGEVGDGGMIGVILRVFEARIIRHVGALLDVLRAVDAADRRASPVFVLHPVDEGASVTVDGRRDLWGR